MQAKSSPSKYILAYDADCGPCTRFAHVVNSFDKYKKIDFMSLTITDQEGLLDRIPVTIRFRSFLKSLVKLYGKHTVYSDGGPWYHEACDSLGLEHKLHSSFEKSIIERAMEYVKDRTEVFDDYYPCKREDFNLKHVYNWIRLLFVFIYNATTVSIKFTVNLFDWR
jgi:hypothetical protein